MSEMNSQYIHCDAHEIHVTCWGNQSLPPVIMWHGLARTGRDFDEVARALSDRYFVICPDTLGRGLSSWARDPASEYSFSVYCDIALVILDYFGISTCRWVGTSMGGLIGVTLAAGLMKERITHLIINDIGPEIPQTAKERIVSYVGRPPVFGTVTELENWLRVSYAQFGENSDVFWRRMTDTSMRRTNEGNITVHYDPHIVSQLTVNSTDFDCWRSFDEIAARTLLFRGAQSDVLSTETASEMKRRGPRPEIITVDGCGHAPTLCSYDEQQILRQFLRT